MKLPFKLYIKIENLLRPTGPKWRLKMANIFQCFFRKSAILFLILKIFGTHIVYIVIHLHTKIGEFCLKIEEDRGIFYSPC